ncbi:MAG TPA: glycosyltransferase family 4 protein [Vicinamibacteria bacterium]|nr:glycosyltransferase family 4 protein [Vicinamibacteria bacterium]
MSRILVAGLCPLPFENTLQSYGPGIRTWQFAWSLARAGHEVRVLAMRTPGAYGDQRPAPSEDRKGIAIERLADVAFLDPTTIRRAIRALQPHALVGASLYGSAALARAGARLPFWADQFGSAMAEAQAQAATFGRDWPVAHAWGLLAPVLRSCDRLSVVSELQRGAAVGELGAVGRLAAKTCGQDLVSVIPCALVPPEEAPPETGGGAPRVARGTVVPHDAFVVLWSGGFNVWSDVETLVAGAEAAMERDGRIHLVSTGGAIPGLDAGSYARFRALVARSPQRERFHLEGWVRAERVASYVAEADVGVLAERPTYDGMLGSKTRIVQWMGGGLPVVCSRVGELGHLLAERQLGLTFPAGDAEALAERLRWAADHAVELRRMAARAGDHARAELGFEVTTRPLAAWAAEPRLAPDAGSRRRVRGPLDHATLRQRLAALGRRVPLARRSELLVELWRRLLGPGG